MEFHKLNFYELCNFHEIFENRMSWIKNPACGMDECKGYKDKCTRISQEVNLKVLWCSCNVY